MKRRKARVQQKAHLFTLISLFMLLFSSLWGFRAYDALKHGAGYLTLLSPGFLFLLTILCIKSALHFFRTEEPTEPLGTYWGRGFLSSDSRAESQKDKK